MRLTKAQREHLATRLIHAAADMLWAHPAHEDVQAALAAQLTQWLKRLPGDAWDTRLPHPEDVATKAPKP